MIGFSFDDVAHYARHMGCSHEQALAQLTKDYQRDQEEREAEDMREFILDGGLWTLFDDEAMDITARLLSTGRV